jgi:iron complex outermembrane receptor protein
MSITLVVYNLFNKMHETNGYTWGYKGGGKYIRENFYYPQAGSHFIGSVKIKI